MTALTNVLENPELICKAFDSSSCGITVADMLQPDMPLVYVNQAFEKMTGYSAAELLGKNCRFLQGSEHHQPEIDVIRQALAERREVDVVIKNYRKDGTLFWNQLRLAPVIDHRQRVTHYIGVQTDVTAQKAAQAETQKYARQLYQCLEAIPFGVLVTDTEGRIFFANQVAGALTGDACKSGATVKELADKCRVTLTGSDYPYPIKAMPIVRALKGETCLASDMDIHCDGRCVPLFLSAAPIYDLNGEIAYAVAVFADISELRDKEAKLAEEEARHRAILNSAIDAIITIDKTGIIQSINPATEHIFGYSQAELLGENVKRLMPAPYCQQHNLYIQRYLETGRAKVIGRGREAFGLRKDGSIFPIDLAVTEVKLPHATIFKGIVRDISARKAAEALAAKSLAELKKSQDDLLSLLNQFEIGSLMLSADHKIEFVSDACEYLTGIDRQSAVGQDWAQVLPFDSQQKLQLQQQFDRAVGERRRITLHWESPARKEYWLDCDIRDDPRDDSRRILLFYDVSEIHQLRKAAEEHRYGRIIGNSEPMRRLYRLISDVARGDWTVLIEGETGTGKELVAQSIHAASQRKDGPFIAVNSAGLSESLLASQLFGHRKGAFTGAVADQAGYFEAAQGGTIFLDEIGDLPLSMQASLLRVLQEKEITRIGETRPRKIDIRIVAATHQDLTKAVQEGRFREDLLYRLRVARVHLPALRERKDDIPLLTEVFLGESYRSFGRTQCRFSREAMQRLMTYHWPGNVRELKACVDYAVIHCQGEYIHPDDLPPEIGITFAAPAEPPSASVLPAADERSRILAAMEKTGGNRQQAAKLLGMSRATFYRRLAELNISRRQDP